MVPHQNVCRNGEAQQCRDNIGAGPENRIKAEAELPQKMAGYDDTAGKSRANQTIPYVAFCARVHH